MKINFRRSDPRHQMYDNLRERGYLVYSLEREEVKDGKVVPRQVPYSEYLRSLGMNPSGPSFAVCVTKDPTGKSNSCPASAWKREGLRIPKAYWKPSGKAEAQVAA